MHIPLFYLYESMKQIMYRLPKSDIYNQQILYQPSIEHIIPRRLFYHKKDANDLLNLSFCDRHTNSKRSDYKYGDYHSIPTIFQEKEWVKPVMNIPRVYYPKKEDHLELDRDLKINISGYINPQKRIFYPYQCADFGLISRSIVAMLSKYPYLYDNLNEIIENPNLLSKWSEYPISEFEEQRNALNIF